MFEQSCFIRKNTFQLRVQLSALGYENARDDVVGDSIATTPVTKHYNTISQAVFDSDDPRVTWKSDRIDCGTNEKLFLAIAALRDDTDKYQWFVGEGTREWYYCEDDYCPKKFISADRWNKATVEELMEYFK